MIAEDLREGGERKYTIEKMYSGELVIIAVEIPLTDGQNLTGVYFDTVANAKKAIKIIGEQKLIEIYG